MCTGLDAANPACYVGKAVNSVVGDAIENMAKAVLEAFSKTIASLGTMWVNIGTPNLTGAGGQSSVAPGSAAPNVGNLATVLGYLMWISLALAVVSLFILGATVATRIRTGEGIASVGRIGLVLCAVILISAASALVAAVLPRGPVGVGGAVAFLQSSLWWYMGAAAVLSVIVGAIRMAWEQRAEPGRELLRSLLTLIVVAGAGVSFVGLLVSAADSFAMWTLDNALNCSVDNSGACFGQNMATLLALTTNPAAGGLGPLLIIILGLIAILATVVQIVLMVARGGMLVILTGILPLSAAATNTEMGRQWFKKCVSWLVAFILYKPAAAIVYAAAFQLVGTESFRDDGTGLLAVLTGLMLMVIALFAMPALMRFVTPMVGALASGGSSGTTAIAGLAALPSGAGGVGRLANGAGGGSTFQPSGAAETAPARGMSTGSASSSPAASHKTSGSAGRHARPGSAAGGGMSGGSAAATRGVAAAGPVGLGVAAGAAAVAAAARTGKQAVEGAGAQSTGEGAEPHGSN